MQFDPWCSTLDFRFYYYFFYYQFQTTLSSLFGYQGKVIHLLTEARHESKLLEVVIISGKKLYLGPAGCTDSVSVKSRNHQVKLS